MTTYKHLFVCPKCDCVASFVDSQKVAKDATFETGCPECGISVHKFWKTKVISEE